MLVSLRVTCASKVSSVTTVSRRGGGGGEVMSALVSWTTGSEVASETRREGNDAFSFRSPCLQKQIASQDEHFTRL